LIPSDTLLEHHSFPVLPCRSERFLVQDLAQKCDIHQFRLAFIRREWTANSFSQCLSGSIEPGRPLQLLLTVRKFGTAFESAGGNAFIFEFSTESETLSQSCLGIRIFPLPGQKGSEVA